MESCVKDNSGVDVFALNAAMFAQYVIPAVYGVESMLLSAVSKAVQPGSSIDSAWAAAVETWKNFMLGFTAIQGVWGEDRSRDVWTKHRHYLLSRCFDAHHVCGVRLLHDFAVGYLLLYEIFIVMGLAFGPVFIACLMFQSTRTWFDGWLQGNDLLDFYLGGYSFNLLLINGIFSG